VSVSTFLVNRAIDVSMLWSQALRRGPFLRTFRRPGQTQHTLLMRILRQNMNTAFGRRHGFATIRTFDDYREHVPVQDFDDLKSLIDSQIAGACALTTSPPVYYARTSGTTGHSKFIPMTTDGLRQIKLARILLAISLWRNTDFFDGSIMGMASPAIEGRFENGIAYGSSSGSIHRSLPALLSRKFAVPPACFDIRDTEAKYQVYALAALARGDVTGIAAANPSSILKVTGIITAQAEVLLTALERRSTADLYPESWVVATEIIAAADKERIRALLRALDTTATLPSELVWPRLSAIATWTGGSCGIALQRLRRDIPARVRVVEYGYAASEFMGAANIDADHNLCMPLLKEHVYEFVQRDDWEAGRRHFLRIEDLIYGQEYYVFVTTQSGLYRYNINDVVRAEPGIAACSALRFLQKGTGVTNITGEKLSEHQVIAAMSDVLAKLDVAVHGYMMLADEEAAAYALHIEFAEADLPSELGAMSDAALRALNGEYDDKRASGRLGPVQVRPLRAGVMEAIRAWRVSEGVREAQYKPVALDYARNWSGRLDSLVLDPATDHLG